MQAPKNGFFYVIDAATGKLISAKNFTEIAWATSVDLKTGRPVENPAARYDVTGKPFLSTHNPNGAHTWHSMAFSPQTGLVYLPIHGTPFIFGNPKSFNPVQMATNVGADFSSNADARSEGRAGEDLRPPDRLGSGEPDGSVARGTRGPANGGALATAGGLVFQGTGSGEFTALDAANGTQLWSQPTQTGVIAAPMTYAIDGEQYVAIMVGTGSSWAMIGGDSNMKGFKLPNVSRLLVYKLGGKVQLPAAPEMQRPPMTPPPATPPPTSSRAARRCTTPTAAAAMAPAWSVSACCPICVARRCCTRRELGAGRHRRRAQGQGHGVVRDRAERGGCAGGARLRDPARQPGCAR